MTPFASAGPVLPLLEGFNPLELDPDFWALSFWTAVVFVILLVLLSKFAWRPLMAAVDSRESKIRDDIEQAEAARQEAETIRAAHQRELEQAAQQAKAALDEVRERAGALHEELKAEARAEADSLITKAREQIDAEKRQAISEIKDQVVELSVEISKRIASRTVDREDHLKEAEVLLGKLGDVVS